MSLQELNLKSHFTFQNVYFRFIIIVRGEGGVWGLAGETGGKETTGET